MGLSILNISNLPNGCTHLITSTSRKDRPVYALAGHTEHANYVERTFLDQMSYPYAEIGVDKISCNLHQAFGVSLPFHLRPNCALQIDLPDSGGEKITVSTFFNEAALREVQTIAHRISEAEEDCSCAQCQSSFIGTSGKPFGRWDIPQDRPRDPLYSFMPATVFKVNGIGEVVSVYYSSSYSFSMISYKYATNLGHELQLQGESDKLINVSITLAKPGLLALAHVIQCAVTKHIPVDIALNENDMEKLHSHSEYWHRCAAVGRQYRRGPAVAMDPLSMGSSLRLAGVARVIFHGTHGIKYPCWVVHGLASKRSEISSTFLFHDLNLSSSAVACTGDECVHLQVEGKSGEIEDIKFDVIFDLKMVCADGDGDIMEGFHVSLTLSDWQRLTGRSPEQKNCNFPPIYGLYNGVILREASGSQSTICVELSRYKNSTIRGPLFRLARGWSMDFSGAYLIASKSKVPDLTLGATSTKDLAINCQCGDSHAIIAG